MDNRQQAYQDPAQLFTQGNYNDRYQRGGSYLRSRPPARSRGGRGQTVSRQNYQKGRVEQMRVAKGTISMEHLDKALQAKLLVGLKDEASGVATKEAAMTETAAPIPVSTRQIGFGVTKFLNAVSQTEKAATLSANNKGTAHQYYRIGLALVEAKLYKTKIRVTNAIDEIEDLPEYRHEPTFLNLTSTVTLTTEPIASVVNSLGIYKDTTDLMFTTTLPGKQSRNQWVPLPENLTLSNLRQTVLSLSNVNTPQAQRAYFRRHNPIPMARWNQNDILTNPDEIMPEGYDDESLEDDISSVRPHMEYVSNKYPTFLSVIDWEKFEITKEIFISNLLAEMRLTEANEQEANLEYVRRAKIIGNHDLFKSRVPQREADLMKGIRNLLGEVTEYDSRIGYYALRAPRYLRYKSTLDYKSVIQMTYVT